MKSPAVKAGFLLVAAFSLLVFLPGLGQKGAVVAFDERLYYGIAASMYAAGEWLVPPSPAEILPGHTFSSPGEEARKNFPAFYKEPLLYWAFMAAFRVLGVSVAAARLVVAIFAAGLAGITFLLGKRLFNEETGRLSWLLLVGALGFFQLGRAMMLDVPFAFFILAGVYLLIEERWIPGALALGCSSLLKGPLGPVLGILIFLGWPWSEKKRPEIPRGTLALGVTVLIGLLISYPLLLAFRGYGKAWFLRFVLAENAGKFYLQRKPAWILITSLLSYQFPWTLLFLGSLIPAFTKRLDARDRFLLWSWAAPLALFVLPSEKIDRFVLPLLPLTLIWLARTLQEFPRHQALRACGTATGVFLFAAGGAAALILSLLRSPAAWSLAFSLLFGSAGFALLVARGRYAPAALLGAFLMAATPFVHALPSRSAVESARAALGQTACSGLESTVDEVFMLTGINIVEIRTPEEIRSALRRGCFVASTHEMKEIPPRRLPPMREAYAWYRWEPALRFPRIREAFLKRTPAPLLEKVTVYRDRGN